MTPRVLTNERLRRRVAGTDPRAWVLHPGFWWGHPTFVATLGLSALGVVLLAPFTYSGWASLLSLLVQALAVWGVWIAARALAATDVDLALVAEMEARGSRYLSDLAAQGGGHVDLERLESTLVPNNPAVPAPGPIRLFQQICKEARDRRFESAANLVQPYRDEASEELFRLQNLQKIALWLGILGTFLGLLVALRQSGGGEAGSDAALTAMVEQMYGGLFVSFTASVAGLEVAIILGFVMLLLRKRQELCFTQLEGAAVTLLSAARHAINHDELIVEFSQVSTSVRDLAGHVYEQTRALADRLDAVDARMREQNDRIDAGMERLAGARGEFERFLRDVGDAEHRFLADLGELFQAASFRDLAKVLREGARDVGAQLTGQLEEAAARGERRFDAFDSSVQGLSAAVQAQSAGFASSVERLQSELAAASSRNSEAIVAACAALSAEMARRRGEWTVDGAVFETLVRRVAELNQSIARLAAPPRWGVREVVASMAPRWWRSRSRYPG